MIKAKSLKSSAIHSLAYWQKQVTEIEQGTFESDGTLPIDCYIALAHKKVEIFTAAIDYMNTLDEDSVASSSEYTHYLKIINS